MLRKESMRQRLTVEEFGSAALAARVQGEVLKKALEA